MSDYANRLDESRQILDAIEEDISVIFLLAGKAFGITSFLKDKLIPQLTDKRIRSFYINANNNGDLSSCILDLVIKDMQLYTIMQDCLNRVYGEKNTTAIQSIVQAVPYAGDLISHIVGRKIALPIYTGNFSSAIEEILTIFFSSLSEEVIIVIDAAQNLYESSYDLISDLINFNKIHVLFSINDYNDVYRKLKNFVFLKGYSCRNINFCAPHEALIIEIGKLFNRKIEQPEAEKIFISSEQNIHKIIEIVSNSNIEYRLDLWAKAIVSVLNICPFPLESNTLYEIIKLSHLYSQHPLDTFKKTLEDLLCASIITAQNGFYELRSIYHPEVNQLLNSYTDQIVYKHSVLKYFQSKGIYNKSTVQLLYSLSCELKDNHCIEYARFLLKYYLQDGSKISDEIILNAKLDKTSSYDCVLCSIIYARKREYSKALKWINNVCVNSNIYLKTFYGVLLNRTRYHSKAEEVLLEVINEIPDSEKKTIAYSFLISNYIHQEKLSDGQNIYLIAKSQCQDTQTLGYLVRNAISLFKKRTPEMYEEALLCFKNVNDMFGYYSTLCNKGYAMLSTDIETGKKDLLEAYEYLNLYGENIAHIVNNDLGIAYLLQNDYGNAKYFFDKVIANEKNGMPKIFAQINLACCDALAGNIDLAVNNILELEENVKNSPLDRVRQKYYINRLMIEYIAGISVNDDLIHKAKKYTDRYNPNKTASSIAFYTKNAKATKRMPLNNWVELYSPCGLVYWFIDPLKIFPEGFLNDIIPI